MDTNEIISSLGVGYLNEMLRDYQHDCRWLQSIKNDLGPESRNLINKAHATIQCAISDLLLLRDMVIKEHQTE